MVSPTTSIFIITNKGFMDQTVIKLELVRRAHEIVLDASSSSRQWDSELEASKLRAGKERGQLRR